MGSRYEHVFSPMRIRGVDFKNRIELAPPSLNLASLDHKVTHEFVDLNRSIAYGGAAILSVGNVMVDIAECANEELQLENTGLGGSPTRVARTRTAQVAKRKSEKMTDAKIGAERILAFLSEVEHG